MIDRFILVTSKGGISITTFIFILIFILGFNCLFKVGESCWKDVVDFGSCGSMIDY